MIQPQLEVGQMAAEDDQVFLMAQQALMIKAPRSAATTVSPGIILALARPAIRVPLLQLGLLQEAV